MDKNAWGDDDRTLDSEMIQFLPVLEAMAARIRRRSNEVADKCWGAATAVRGLIGYVGHELPEQPLG